MNGAGSCECTQWLGFIGKHKSIFTVWRIDHYTTTPCTWPLTGCGKAGAVAEGRACRAPPSSLHATASVSTDKARPSCHSERVDRQGQAFVPQRACRQTRSSLHATASVSTDKAKPSCHSERVDRQGLPYTMHTWNTSCLLCALLVGIY